MSSDFPQEFKDEIIKYSPDDLIEWILVTSALPGNAENLVRLETLAKLVISMKESDFQNNNLSQENFANILGSLDGLWSWSSVEDFVPCSMEEYPPLWILGKRYRILPGLQDRVYEYWKHFVHYYYPLSENFKEQLHYDPVEIVPEILELHDKVFNFLKSNSNRLLYSHSLFIPSEELKSNFINLVNEWFSNTSQREFFEKNSVKLGDISGFPIVEPEPYDSIYKTLFVKIQEKYIPIFLHCQYGSLYTIVANDCKQIPNVSDLIQEMAHNRVYKKLIKVFSRFELIPHFSIKHGKMHSFAATYDSNKLFLFNIINTDFLTTTLNDKLKEIQANIEDTENKIKAGEKVCLNHM